MKYLVLGIYYLIGNELQIYNWAFLIKIDPAIHIGS